MKFLVAGMLWILGITQAVAETQASAQLEVEAAKRSVIEIGNDISVIERRLLSPVSTKASLYIALNSGSYFRPLTLKVTSNSFQPVSYVYTERDVRAMMLGGIQPLSEISMAPGRHNLKVVIEGMDDLNRKRNLVYEGIVTKTGKHLNMLLSIVDNTAQRSAVATFKAW